MEKHELFIFTHETIAIGWRAETETEHTFLPHIISLI